MDYTYPKREKMAGERILVVDDEVHITLLCTKLLTQHGYAAEGVTSAREAIARLEAEARPQGAGFHLLVVDIKMPGIDGLTVLRRGRELDPNLAAIVITGYGTLDSVIEALHAGTQRFLLKPFDSNDLLLAVEETLEHRRKEMERLWQQVQLPILQIGQALFMDGSMESLAGYLLMGMMLQVGADRAALLLLEEGAGRLYVTKADSLVTGMGVEAPVPVEPGIVTWALQQKEPLILDENSPAVLDPSVRALLIGPETSIGVCLPLRTQRTVGLLCLSRPASRAPFASTDIHLLSMMTGQIAMALENAHQYRKLLDSRDYFRTILDSLHDEVVVLNGEHRITDANATFLRNTGLNREEVIGRPCQEVYNWRHELCDDPTYPCSVTEVERTGQPAQCLHLHRDRTGKVGYVNIAASPLYNRQGEIAGVVEALRDITSEWQLESSLATVRDLGQELVLSRDEMEIARLVVNAAEKIIGSDRCGLWLADEQEGVLRLLATTAPSQAIPLSPLPLDSERGITVAVARSGQAIYLPDVRQDPRYLGETETSRSELCVPLKVKGRVLGVLNAESPEVEAFDEADRRLFATLADQAALALENARLYRTVAQAEREWAETFDAITDGIAVIDTDFRILHINRTLANWLGSTPEALIGVAFHKLPGHSNAPFETWPCFQMMRDDQPDSVTFEMKMRGQDRVLSVSVYPLHDARGALKAAVHVLKDVTERKRMEQQLIQSEKVAALGRLAASLAHEINNPLQALRSGLGLLLKSSYDREKQQQYLQVANREVERLIAITGQMLNFYRPSIEQRRQTNINSLLDEVLTLAGKKLQHSQITLVRKLNHHLPEIEVIADQLRQVFLNIVLNALDAMPGGGKLTVASGFNRQRQEVWISFTDTGEGIPPEDIPHIFEPLYSTKPQGTGLGLAISYSIIERHNGRIEVQSQVGKGSTFTVFLPI